MMLIPAGNVNLRQAFGPMIKAIIGILRLSAEKSL